MIVAGDPSAPRRAIDFPYSEVRRLIGVDVPRAEGEAILDPARLRRRGRPGQSSRPGARTSRCKADVVEQIIRIAGLDRAPAAPLPRLDDGRRRRRC